MRALLHSGTPAIKSQSSSNEGGPPSSMIASIKSSNFSLVKIVVKQSSHVGGSGSSPTTILLLLFIHTILEFLLESDCLSLPSSLSSSSLLLIEFDSCSSSYSSASCATAIGPLIGNPISTSIPLRFTLILLHLTFFTKTLL